MGKYDNHYSNYSRSAQENESNKNFFLVIFLLCALVGGATFLSTVNFDEVRSFIEHEIQYSKADKNANKIQLEKKRKEITKKRKEQEKAKEQAANSKIPGADTRKREIKPRIDAPGFRVTPIDYTKLLLHVRNSPSNSGYIKATSVKSSDKTQTDYYFIPNTKVTFKIAKAVSNDKEFELTYKISDKTVSWRGRKTNEGIIYKQEPDYNVYELKRYTSGYLIYKNGREFGYVKQAPWHLVAKKTMRPMKEYTSPYEKDIAQEKQVYCSIATLLFDNVDTKALLTLYMESLKLENSVPKEVSNEGIFFPNIRPDQLGKIREIAEASNVQTPISSPANKTREPAVTSKITVASAAASSRAMVASGTAVTSKPKPVRIEITMDAPSTPGEFSVPMHLTKEQLEGIKAEAEKQEASGTQNTENKKSVSNTVVRTTKPCIIPWFETLEGDVFYPVNLFEVEYLNSNNNQFVTLHPESVNAQGNIAVRQYNVPGSTKSISVFQSLDKPAYKVYFSPKSGQPQKLAWTFEATNDSITYQQYGSNPVQYRIELYGNKYFIYTKQGLFGKIDLLGRNVEATRFGYPGKSICIEYEKNQKDAKLIYSIAPLLFESVDKDLKSVMFLETLRLELAKKPLMLHNKKISKTEFNGGNSMNMGSVTVDKEYTCYMYYNDKNNEFCQCFKDASEAENEDSDFLQIISTHTINNEKRAYVALNNGELYSIAVLQSNPNGFSFSRIEQTDHPLKIHYNPENGNVLIVDSDERIKYRFELLEEDKQQNTRTILVKDVARNKVLGSLKTKVVSGEFSCDIIRQKATSAVHEATYKLDLNGMTVSQKYLSMAPGIMLVNEFDDNYKYAILQESIIYAINNSKN